jgi:UDP-glucose 4-epimerase
MTVLVTGGAGFIGSHLADRLVAQGSPVTVLDDLRTGRVANIRHLLDHEGFELKVGDLRDPAVLRAVADRGTFDVIYHLAAIHYIPECVAHPVDTLSVNVVGTQALLSSISFRRMVFASTGDVYAPRQGSHREDESPAPFNVYGLSKFFGERLLESVSRVRESAAFVIARLFNVYGPRETNPHIIPQILQEIRGGNHIRLGNLFPRRDYTYVADTVEALLALGDVPLSSPLDVFNVGTGVTASVEDLVTLLQQILGTSLQVEVDPDRARPIERPHLQADTSKIQRATTWRPTHSLREGLKQVCMADGLLP